MWTSGGLHSHYRTCERYRDATSTYATKATSRYTARPKATVWVLTQDHLASSVYRVPVRRNIRPDWVRRKQVALGRRIADLRRAADLSQDQLADRVGVERRTIQRYETATRDPRYADLLLLADALRVPVADLFRDGQGSTPPEAG